MREGLFSPLSREERYKYKILVAEGTEKSVGGFEPNDSTEKNEGESMGGSEEDETGDIVDRSTVTTTKDGQRRERRERRGIQDNSIQSNNSFSSNWQSERHLRARSSIHIKDLFTSVFNTKSILAHIDGQTEAVLSDVVSIKAIVDSDGGVAASGPLHSARLGARPRWVRTPVLSVGDPEVRVVGLSLYALDGLGRVRDVGVVDERTVPGEEAISTQLTERKRTKSYFSFKKLTSSISPYSPKSLFNLSSLKASKSSIFPMYTFLVAPEWTESARAGGSGPEFLPQPTFSLRLLRVKPWKEATW